MAIRERRNEGPSGLGSVKVGKNSVRIDLDEGGVYEIPLAGVPDAKNGRYRISITRDKQKAYLHPLPGQYIFSFAGLGARVNNIPTVKIQRGGPRQTKAGGTWIAPDEQIFVATFKVESENNYKGQTTSTNLPFAFAAPQSGENCDIYDSKRNIARLELFLRVAGGVENLGMFEIPYYSDPSAILVWLEKFLLKQGKVFTASIGERGFFEIDTMASIPEELLSRKKGSKK